MTRPKIKVFVASSTNGLDVARSIKDCLENRKGIADEVLFDVTVWNQEGVFSITRVIHSSLVDRLGEFDFAIGVLTTDDRLDVPEPKTWVPRDNVVFELGLFMGFLGPDRTFLTYDVRHRPKFPSDLDGVIGAPYEVQDDGTLDRLSLQQACSKMQGKMLELEVRSRSGTPMIDYAPIEDGGELAFEFQVAWDAIRQVKETLDSLFAGGQRTDVFAQFPLLRVDGDSQGIDYVNVAIEYEMLRILRKSHHKSFCASLGVKWIERHHDQLGSRFWLVEPIDGSRHINKHSPLFATTLSLVERDPANPHGFRAMVGMTYIPLTREWFFAVRGRGAFLNNSSGRLRKLVNVKPQKSTVCVELPNIGYKDDPQFKKSWSGVADLARKVRRIRSVVPGAYALAYVAKGIFDAYLDFSRTSTVFDMAAGCLLVEEVGGRVVDLNAGNGNYPSYRAYNPGLEKTFQEIGLI